MQGMQMGMRRLSEVFRDLLREKGIERVWPCTKFWKLSAMVAEGKAVVCRAERCRISMDLSGVCENVRAQACVIPAERCSNVLLDRRELMDRLAREGIDYPYVLVDCRYHNLHTDKELRRLRLQLKCTAGVVREFMWGERMVVTGKKFEEVEVPFYRSARDFFAEKNVDRVLLLDPNAEEVFGEKDRGERCYVIGGIVDLCGNKKGLTSRLGKELEREGVEVVSRKFVLRGDVVGVPDRINSIAEILLRCVIDGQSLEDAILAVQTPLVARWRLRKELAKLSFRLDRKLGLPFPVRAVVKEDFEKLGWLNVGERDFYRECRKMGFVVVSSSFLDGFDIGNGIKSGETEHESGRKAR